MKLLNQSLVYLSICILIIVSIWSVVFYNNMLEEVYDSVDDGLDNYKYLIIKKSKTDSTVFEKSAFNESNYAIREISPQEASKVEDTYKDTLMYMQSEEDLEPVRELTTVFQNGSKYYELRVISSIVEEDDQIENMFWAILWLYFILIISIVIINNIVLQRLWKPFYKLLFQLKTFRIDKNSKMPDIKTSTKEFVELKNATNTLIKHTLEAYSNQKQFIENAAHELQTPLAIANNKLELLIEKNDLSQNNAEDIGEILQIVQRLTKLNKSLLLLSKIENKQFFDNIDLAINEVVQRCLEDLEEFAQFKAIEITVDEPDSIFVEIDPTLADILISNLLKNAVFHNKPEGKVTINISKNVLSICNTSPSDKLDEQKVFKRFYKNTGEQKHTGLGLAIVQAICNLYDFKLSYHFADQHCFEIQFAED